MEWKNRETHNALVRGHQLCTRLSIFEGSLAELLRFWCCQLEELRKSRTIASFLTLSSSKVEEVSQNCCVFDVLSRSNIELSRRIVSLLLLSSSNIEQVSQTCFVFDVVKLKNEEVSQNCFVLTLTSWPCWPAAAWKMGHKQWCTPRDCQLGKDTMDRVCLFWPHRPAAAPRTWDTCSEAHRVKPMALVWLLRNGLTACPTFFLAVLPFWMLVLDVCLPFSYLSFLTVRSHGCCLFAPQRQGKKRLSCVVCTQGIVLERRLTFLSFVSYSTT